MKTNVSWPAVTTAYKPPNMYQLSSWCQALIKHLSPSVGKKFPYSWGAYILARAERQPIQYRKYIAYLKAVRIIEERKSRSELRGLGEQG